MTMSYRPKITKSYHKLSTFRKRIDYYSKKKMRLQHRPNNLMTMKHNFKNFSNSWKNKNSGSRQRCNRLTTLYRDR